MSLPPPLYGDRLISGMAVHVNFQPVLSIRKLDFTQLCPFTEGLPNRGRVLCPMPAQEEREGAGGVSKWGGQEAHGLVMGERAPEHTLGLNPSCQHKELLPLTCQPVSHLVSPPTRWMSLDVLRLQPGGERVISREGRKGRLCLVK